MIKLSQTRDIELKLRHPAGLAFDINFASGHKITVDGGEEFGGQNLGPRPMQLLLASLASCTSMDVISILHKMRQPVEEYRIQVAAEQAEDHPKIFTSITIKHIVTGKVDEERLARAIELSDTKYCPASAMLRAVAQITTEYEIRQP